MEDYKVQVVQSSLQRPFKLPPEQKPGRRRAAPSCSRRRGRASPAVGGLRSATRRGFGSPRVRAAGFGAARVLGVRTPQGGQGRTAHRGDGCSHRAAAVRKPAVASAPAPQLPGRPTQPENPVRGGAPGRGGALTSPPLPQPLQGGGREPQRQPCAAAPGRNSSTRRLAAWTCPDKLGSPGPLPALARSPAASFRCSSLPLSGGRSGDAATWVPAVRADRALVGDMLKIRRWQSWHLKHGC